MVTIKEVAKRAGVSSSTVSNVYTGSAPVREETRQKVLTAADALNYIPNSVATSLRRGRTNLVAVCISDIANPSLSSLVRGASNVFRSQNHHPLIFSSDENPEMEQEILSIVREQRVAGLLISPTEQTASRYQEIVDLGIRIVCVDRRVRGFDTVRIDDTAGFRKATEHLLDQGHRRLGIIAGPKESLVSLERRHGFQETLLAHGVDLRPEVIFEGPSTERFGYDSFVQLINHQHPPSGVVTTSTRLMLGALYAMRDYGVKRPDQMALIGSADRDLEWISLFEPPLTVVAQPSRKMGRKAPELLIAQLTGQRDDAGDDVLIDSELIVGYPQQPSHS